MLKDTWRCVDCGETFRTRRDECPACGNGVIDPIVAADPGPRPGVRVAAERVDEDADPQWTCRRCGREHSFEPTTCVSCGEVSFTYSGPSRERDFDSRIPPGFPTSAEAIRQEARNREYENPVELREILLLVLLCLGFVVVLTLYVDGFF